MARTIIKTIVYNYLRTFFSPHVELINKGFQVANISGLSTLIVGYRKLEIRFIQTFFIYFLQGGSLQRFGRSKKKKKKQWKTSNC